ncbi:hypothetical protein F4776DRAFT_265543 [Hypoxylon sp. NC0597]|nr:hypothetical protein F4776DRAFT_265543 [Hypoxylon sp. NC0597]
MFTFEPRACVSMFKIEHRQVTKFAGWLDDNAKSKIWVAASLLNTPSARKINNWRRRRILHESPNDFVTHDRHPGLSSGVSVARNKYSKVTNREGDGYTSPGHGNRRYYWYLKEPNDERLLDRPMCGLSFNVSRVLVFSVVSFQKCLCSHNRIERIWLNKGRICESGVGGLFDRACDWRKSVSLNPDIGNFSSFSSYDDCRFPATSTSQITYIKMNGLMDNKH